MLLSFGMMAQNATLRDNSTQEPIPDVIAIDKNNLTAISDVKGKIDLSTLDKTDSLLFIHTSYNSIKVFISKDTSLNLTTKSVILDEIVFSVNKNPEKKIEVPYLMEVVKQKDIEFANQANTGDLMQNTGMVALQKSQAGGGSITMRGFEANKILLVVDGVRMNNAIYRGGHLQDIMTIDANMLDRTEMIFGPASTMYGSDALGGVIHFYTKNAAFSTDDKLLVKANAMFRYASACTELTGHVDFNIGTKNFASMTNITYSRFGDLMSGSTKLPGYSDAWNRNYYVQRFDNKDSMVANPNNNLQKGSGYSQLDVMQRFNLITGENFTHNLNFQFSMSPDLPRYDRLAGDYSGGNLRFAENGYSQNRLLAAYTLNYTGQTVISDNIKLIVAYQKIDQDRITRNFQNVNRRTQREDVSVVSANLDFLKKIKEKHEIRYGLEFTYNDVLSTSEFLNIKTDSAYNRPGQTRYADGGNTMITAALYGSHTWRVSPRFVITDGLRFTFNHLKSVFNSNSAFEFPFSVAEQNNYAFTGSLGFVWKEEDNYKVSFLFNTGFRTPNIDDMSKVFDSGGDILIVPNPNINPEYAINFELGLSKVFDKKYKFDISGFYTSLQNALVLADYKFNGQDSVLFNGVMSKTQAIQNFNNAYILGLTAGVQFDFNPHITFKSTISYTYGRYMDTKKDTLIPLDHIPPLFGQTSLIFNMKNMTAEFFVRYSGEKSSADYSPSGEDNIAYSADPVKGFMPAWFTLNLRVGYNITKNLRLNLACENITDNRYRTFASGINSAGRNFIVSLRFKI